MTKFRLTGRVEGTFWAPRESGTFVTSALSPLLIEHAGIPGDKHFGHLRQAGGREPWYSKGERILNLRMLTAISVEELAEIARRLKIPEVKPEWLGENVLISEIPDLSFLPPITKLLFPSGAVLLCTGQNPPCKAPGKIINQHHPHVMPELFANKAHGLRGITLTVERPGLVRLGDTVTVEVPQQTLYVADVSPEG